MIAELLPTALSELYVQTTTSGKVTVADRYGLMVAILTGELPIEDRRIVDRILYSLRRGRMRLVDELSALQS